MRYRLAASVVFAAALLAIAGVEPSGAATDVGCDLNGDGFGDLAVGAPGAAHNDRRNAGEVEIYLGSPGGLPATRDTLVRPGIDGLPGFAKHDAEFGAAIGCGELSGDGYDDLVIGAPGERIVDALGAGAVYVVYGSDSLSLAGSERFSARTTGVPGVAKARASFAFALAVADVVGDGNGDLIVGVPGQDAVVALPGSAAGVTSSGAVRYQDNDLDELGSSLAVGDVDGDGEADLVAGAPGTDVAGSRGVGAVAVWIDGALVTAPEVITYATPGIAGSPRAHARFGHAIAVGDRDGDGFDDVAVGAPGYRFGTAKRAGDVLLVYGTGNGIGVREDRFNMNRLSATPAASDGFGWAVHLADLDGDSTPELIVGTPRRRGIAPRMGLVTVIPAAGRVLHGTLTSLGQPRQSGHGLGGAVASGDYDRNGRADLAIGLQGAGVDELRAGAVVLIYGRQTLHLDPPQHRPATLRGTGAGTRFGVVGNGQAPDDLPLLSVKMRDRDAWGARDPVVARLENHTITRLTIHHAGRQSSGTGPAVYRGWQSWHMDHHRWGDVAYHIIIGADGRVFAARPWRFRGDTATNYDPEGHLLVVVEGNFDDEEPTAQQLDLLPKVVAWAADKYALDLHEVLGHRDHAATSCPGDNLYPYIASGDLAADVAELRSLGRIVLDA